MGVVFCWLLAVAHHWFPGGVFEGTMLALVWIYLAHGLLHVLFLNRKALVGYAWRVVRDDAPELRLLRQPRRIWLLEQIVLYLLAMVFIAQGYYFITVAMTINAVVRATLLEALWGRGFWEKETEGLMKQTKDYVATLKSSVYRMEA